jgi:hypothetical protein
VLGETERHRFVFVGGLHRSGTSPLARWLASHPNVSALSTTGAPEDEGQHLQGVYPPAMKFGGPGRFGFARAAHLTEDSPMVTSRARGELLNAWMPFWNASKPVLLEKSPPNLIRTRFLQALFPKSRAVMIVRHPMVVAFATQKWSGTSIESLLAHWAVCHRRLLDDAPHVERLALLRYEDLVAAPGPILAEIWRFLGLEPAGFVPDVRPGLNDAYLSISKGELASPDVREAVANCEPTASLFGYSLSDAKLRPASGDLPLQMIGA